MVLLGAVASILPDTIGPYLGVMIGGFVISIYGQLAKSRTLIILGIAMIFLATLLIPLALQVFSEEPPPPGPKVPLAMVR